MEKKTQLKSISIRVPADLYEEYKTVLRKESKIVTYDLRNHMKKTVDEDKKD